MFILHGDFVQSLIFIEFLLSARYHSEDWGRTRSQAVSSFGDMDTCMGHWKRLTGRDSASRRIHSVVGVVLPSLGKFSEDRKQKRQGKEF
jgi:hypothetical protein